MKQRFLVIFYILISYSFYPHITLPTRFSNNNGTLIDKLFCKLNDSAIKPKSGILTKQLSDHQPYITFLNTVPHKEPSPKHIKINIQMLQMHIFGMNVAFCIDLIAP